MGEMAELYIEAEMHGLDEPDWDGMVQKAKRKKKNKKPTAWKEILAKRKAKRDYRPFKDSINYLF